MKNLSVLVTAEWDDEGQVWVATSEDVPGLVVQHADFGRLRTLALELIPMLLIENGIVHVDEAAFDVPVHFAAQAVSRGQARIAA